MRRINRFATLSPAFLLGVMLQAAPAWSDDEPSPLEKGMYAAPLASGVFPTDKSELKTGFGGILALGYRKDFYAVEIAPTYGDLDRAKFYGASVNGLLFPFKSLPGLYATLGINGTQLHRYRLPEGGTKDFSTVNGDGGIGYILPLSFGSYEFGIRAEARYRVGRRESDYNDADIDINAPRHFTAALLNVGLQLPLRIKHKAEAPPEPPVTVVPVADGDGDGVLDPADQCPDTPRGTKVDARGCPLPKPECKAPMPGEHLSLEGCAAGDVIVLNGVNFEFDQSRLTVNAKTILDELAGALNARPDIEVELGGYTDSRGADDYNQKLSEARAQSVRAYLESCGVASGRIAAMGFGETRPVASNDSDAGREHNRRVELKVTAGASALPAVAPN